MASLLAPSSGGRSRSKSPGGRDRSRSRSRDGRSDDERDRDRRKSSKKYSETESEYESDVRRSSRYEERRPSKKSYDSHSEDDRRARRGSKRYDVSDDDRRERKYSSRKKDESEDDRREKKSSSRRKDDSDDDRRERKHRSSKSKKKSDTESEGDQRRRAKDRKKAAREETESSEEDDRRKSKSKPKSSNGAAGPQNVAPVYAQPTPYAYANNTYPPNVYPAGPPGNFPNNNGWAPQGGVDPRYGPVPPGYQAAPRTVSNAGPQYAQPDRYQYAQPGQEVQYQYRNERDREPAVSKHYDAVDIKPSKSGRDREKSYVDDKYRQRDEKDAKREKKYRDDTYDREQGGSRRGSYQRERAPSNVADANPDELKKRLGRLSVAGLAGGATLGAMSGGGGKPPASPLLEAYKGTYQSISPMPSPLSSALVKKDDDLSDLDLDSDGGLSDGGDIKRKIKELEKEKQKLDARSTDSPRSSSHKLELREPGSRSRATSDALSVVSSTSSKKKKSVSFYDPAADAKAIANALSGNHRSPDVKPLLRIMPYLTTDELILLKTEYKNHAKINGQGINMSKHIKARITGNLGKVIYATSLGQYESDAFWANCFYQSGASRRELLIESLVGRSNQQIREIKDVFKDKRYDDDLEVCMKSELKADKFRSAILLALEERRMPENLALDIRRVQEDVIDLHEALTSAGGESAMIKIIILRSDQHLREILRVYEKTYHRNFARDMIEKSRNLVGETLAHMLNGALNKAMRDALLLHQAIAETAPGKERAELLISRVVRLHWDPKHLERVKAVYEQRYRQPLEVAIKKEVQANMKTDEGKMWTQFCIELVRSSDPSL